MKTCSCVVARSGFINQSELQRAWTISTRVLSPSHGKMIVLGAMLGERLVPAEVDILQVLFGSVFSKRAAT